MENHKLGLFATSTVHNHNAPVLDGAIPGVPSIEKITFHLVRFVLIQSSSVIMCVIA